MEDLLSGLTASQAEAVTHTQGACLVVAGAGTGKTTVISRRIARLILDEGVQPEEILALTFTDKAAGEMQERVDILLPYGMFGTTISTFHSFCHDLVRRHAFTIGVDPNARLIGKAEEVSLLRANQQKLPLNHYKPPANPVSFLRQLAAFMDRAKEEQISPEALEEHGKQALKEATDEAGQEAAERTIELAGCYRAANQLYAQSNILTYADLIAYSLKILTTSALARKEEQTRFKYVLIDEFQDTNTTQAEICYLLAGEQGNIFVVGDDDQAIYRFRGANLDNIMQFRKRYPDADLITLRDNFRSTQPILDAAYTLIQENNPYRLEVQEKIDKKLISHSESPTLPVEDLYFSSSPYEEEGVVRRIEALINQGYQPSDIAILARGHSHLDPFEHELLSTGIPVRRQKDGSFYQLPTVERAMAYLRFVVKPHDSFNLFFLLSEPPFSLDINLLRELNVTSRKINNSLWTQIGLTPEPTDNLAEAYRFLTEKIESDIRKPTDALRDFITSSSWEKLLTEADDRDAFNALNTLYNEARSFELMHRPVVLPQYLSHIDELIASGEDIKVESELGEEQNGVNLMTIHASKGLEFPIVFIVNMVMDRFPGANRSSGIPLPEELVKPQVDKVKHEEERRLAYVALTRAKEQLILTHSEQYSGNKRTKKPSPFLLEALGGTAQTEFADVPLRTGQLAATSSRLHLTAHLAAPTVYSASALECFDDSPQRYLEEHVYRLPREENSAAGFGTCIHEVLNCVFSAMRARTPMSEEAIEAQYQKCWRPEGFETKEQELERYGEGLRAIQAYLAKIEPGFIPDRLEHPVQLTLENGIKVIGKIDRIDRLPDGTLQIVDYKTGRKTATKADIKKNLPLAIYAAALAQHRETVSKVSLHYLLTGENVELPVDDAFLAQTRQKAEDIIAAIEEAYRTNVWPEGNTYFIK